MTEFVKTAKRSDLKPGEARVVECAGRTLALCQVEDKYYALDNTCLHRGGPIGEGFIDGNTVTCPWHGWQYDVATGEMKMNSAMKLSTFETKLEGDDILVKV